jgi:hypothetical protein
MANILIVGTKRYSINMCDFDLLFRNSKHDIVHVLYNKHTETFPWFHSGEFGDPARNKIATKLKKHPHSSWSTHDEFMTKVSKIDFDYICMGNGNDDAGVQIQKDLKGKKFLFSEYGWLPWKESAYIDNVGVGKFSSIYDMGIDDILSFKGPDNTSTMNRTRQLANHGNKMDLKDYIYVSLQTDTLTSDGKPDFKFKFTNFKKNEEFLAFIESIVPKEMTIVAQDHPFARRKTNMSSRIVNITGKGINMYEVYSNMKAMVCINSTAVLESMLYNKKLFTYGKDLFCNKSLTYEGVETMDHFVDMVQNAEIQKYRHEFINFLMNRQVCRHRCNDLEYVNSHFWTNNL